MLYIYIRKFGDFRVLPIPYNMVEAFLNISFVVLLDRPMCTSRWLAYFLSTKALLDVLGFVDGKSPFFLRVICDPFSLLKLKTFC